MLEFICRLCQSVDIEYDNWRKEKNKTLILYQLRGFFLLIKMLITVVICSILLKIDEWIHAGIQE